MRWWEEVFPEHERAIYEATHKGQPQARGQRPALLVIDVTRAFCGEPGQSMIESIRTWPTSCGPHAWTAMRHTHAVNLFELNAKYADVITVGEATQWLGQLAKAQAVRVPE